MGSSFVLIVLVAVISGLGAERPRCVLDLEAGTAEKLVRCYSLENLTLLERFIEDDRPVKVQVVNGPLDEFHLFSARANRNEPAVADDCADDG